MDLTQAELDTPLPDQLRQLRAELCRKSEERRAASEVAEWLQTLAEQVLDDEYQGIGELLTLLAEQVEAETEADEAALLNEPQCEQLSTILMLLAEPAQSDSWLEILLPQLQSPHWSRPLAEEDLTLLPELLAQDRERLGLSDATGETESAPGPERLLQSCFEQADTPEELAESLVELSERLSEQTDQAIADLLALGGEAIAACETLTEEPIAALVESLIELVRHPSKDSADNVLSLLAAPAWPEPLDDIDLQDQRDLLEQLFAQASTACSAPDIGLEDVDGLDESDEPADEIPLSSEPVESIEVAESDSDSDSRPEPEEALPPFCQVDLSRLEQSGPSVDPGILAMLADSLRALEQQWQTELPQEAVPKLIESSIDALQPLERACRTISLAGVELLLNGLIVNLDYFARHPDRFYPYSRIHFARTLGALHGHLEALADRPVREALIDCLSDDSLPIPADVQQTAFLSGLLALAGIQSLDEIELQTAAPEDLVLAVGEGVDAQLLEMLYAELPLLVEEFQQQLAAITGRQESAALLSAQRAAHTIKGLANMAGIRGLANLTHHLEDILELLTEAQAFPGEQLAQDLTDAADCLAMMSDAVTGGGESPPGALAQLQQLMHWYYRLRTEGIDCAAAALDDEERERRREQAERDAAESLMESVATPAAAGEHREVGQIRVSVGILDNLFRIAGEASTLGAQLDATLMQMRRLSRSGRDRQRNLQKVLFELEQQLQDHFTLNPALQEGESDFDPLEMDRYHAMHTTLSQLQEATADLREVEQEAEQQLRQLSELQVAQHNLNKESLDNVLNTRLVAVRTLSSRMQRIMRQACRAAGKEARLLITGEDVLVDSQILNRLADPLMHLIRNAVDHGLETPHLRFEAGKEEIGTLSIHFRHANGKVQVVCEDDGAGIDLHRVREIAERKGLVAPDAELSETDIQRLILLPGFSTRDEISQLSGRGIGMDVVYQQVSRMQGTLGIHSRQGQGTRFELAMPASSLLVHTLLVRSAGDNVFALSSHTVEQNLLSLDGQCRRNEEGLVFVTADAEYPVFTLEGLVGERVPDYAALRIHPVLLVNLDQGDKAVVFVREILAHREQVFKPLGEHLPDIPGLPGVTILANGEIAPIIDLQARVRHCHSRVQQVGEWNDVDTGVRLPRLLVVDDSLSARKTLETLLSDSGYEVVTAIDGLDALDKIRRAPPDLILTDLEMPRMTGMELAEVVRKSRDFGSIPVIMVTSRSTAKHRLEAQAAGVTAYLTKPWTESTVLEQVGQLLF